MSEGTLRRTREDAMRRRAMASLIRDSRRRSLPAKHGHAARPQATREYQSDTSSKQRPRSSISPRSGTGSPRPPPLLLDNRSLHISVPASGVTGGDMTRCRTPAPAADAPRRSRSRRGRGPGSAWPASREPRRPGLRPRPGSGRGAPASRFGPGAGRRPPRRQPPRSRPPSRAAGAADPATSRGGRRRDPSRRRVRALRPGRPAPPGSPPAPRAEAGDLDSRLALGWPSRRESGACDEPADPDRNRRDVVRVLRVHPDALPNPQPHVIGIRLPQLTPRIQCAQWRHCRAPSQAVYRHPPSTGGTQPALGPRHKVITDRHPQSPAN